MLKHNGGHPELETNVTSSNKQVITNSHRRIGSKVVLQLRAGGQSVELKARVQEAYRLTHTKYQDPDFPADKESLTQNWHNLDARTKMAWTRLQWLQIDSAFKAPIKVFNQIEPDDIMQGALGDCYFLSALSALAEYPNRIERLFDTKEYEPSGCYIVSMLETGIVQDYIIDDYFPCTRAGKPAFSGPKISKGVSELWVVILEKAYAKRFGSYDAIQAGFTEDVLRDLTGAPCEETLSTNPRLWEKLVHGNSAKYIMTASTDGDVEDQDTTNELGLVALHAYSVIEAAEITSKQRTEKLLKIRNPWGQTEWKGDWSDNSVLWTPEIKRQLGWTNVDDGSFWMRFEDFKEWFSSVIICRARDDYVYSSILATQPKGAFKVFEIKLDMPATSVISVTLPDQRHFGYDSDFSYPVVRLAACFVNEQDQALNEFLGGRSSIFARDVWREFVTSRPGKLLVFAEVDWETDHTTEFGLSCYSSSTSTIEDVTESYPDALSFIYSPSFAKEAGEAEQLRQNVMLYEGIRTGGDKQGRFNEGFLYHYLENKTSNLRATIEVQFSNFENLELMYPDSGNGYRVVLEPGQFATIVAKHSKLNKQMNYTKRVRKEFQEI